MSPLMIARWRSDPFRRLRSFPLSASVDRTLISKYLSRAISSANSILSNRQVSFTNLHTLTCTFSQRCLINTFVRSTVVYGKVQCLFNTSITAHVVSALPVCLLKNLTFQVYLNLSRVKVKTTLVNAWCSEGIKFLQRNTTIFSHFLHWIEVLLLQLLEKAICHSGWMISKEVFIALWQLVLNLYRCCGCFDPVQVKWCRCKYCWKLIAALFHSKGS